MSKKSGVKSGAKKSGGRRPIPASAWKVPSHAADDGDGVTVFEALEPRHRVGDIVMAATDIPYPDVTVPQGTTGVVTNVTEFGDEIFYFVIFDGDTLERLTREAHLE